MDRCGGCWLARILGADRATAATMKTIRANSLAMDFPGFRAGGGGQAQPTVMALAVEQGRRIHGQGLQAGVMS